MRRIITMLLASVMCITLVTGCGSSTASTEPEEPKYADEQFIIAMGQGLESRWYKISIDEQKEGYNDLLVTSEEYKNMMISYADAELKSIEEYQTALFENSKLQENAVTYINLLKKHKEICEYMTVDYDKYLTEYEPIYNERSLIIGDMVENYGLTVSAEYESNLNDFITNSKLVAQQNQIEDEINMLVSNIQFECVLSEYDWKTYQAIVENTTSMDFESFNLSINLLNAEGVIVETTYASVGSFAKGAKAQFEFMTDKDFASTQITADWWE